jgi:hypothetical protein
MFDQLMEVCRFNIDQCVVVFLSPGNWMLGTCSSDDQEGVWVVELRQNKREKEQNEKPDSTRSFENTYEFPVLQKTKNKLKKPAKRSDAVCGTKSKTKSGGCCRKIFTEFGQFFECSLVNYHLDNQLISILSLDFVGSRSLSRLVSEKFWCFPTLARTM